MGDPDYQGPGTATVNVDGAAKAGAKTGTPVPFVYSNANGGNKKVKFSFDPSFIGEQVNASIQALPNDVVRYSYVHTVFNYGADADNVFIYPSMGVPKFSSVIGAGHCSPDSAKLDASCANANNFNGGKSVAVNDQKYRFPYWVGDGDTTKGADAVAAKYTNCAQI